MASAPVAFFDCRKNASRTSMDTEKSFSSGAQEQRDQALSHIFSSSTDLRAQAVLVSSTALRRVLSQCLVAVGLSVPTEGQLWGQIAAALYSQHSESGSKPHLEPHGLVPAAQPHSWDLALSVPSQTCCGVPRVKG